MSEGVTRRHATRDVLIQLAGRAANVAGATAVTVVAVRTLGSDYGRWATLLAVFLIAAYVTDLGLRHVAVQRAAVAPQQEAELISALLVIRSAIAPVVAVMVAAIGLAIADTAEMRVAAVLVGITSLLAVPATLSTIFMVRVRNDLGVFSETVYVLVWGAGVVALAVAGAGLVAFAGLFAIATAVATAVRVHLSLRLGARMIAPSRALVRDLLVQAVPLGISSMLIVAYARLDQVLVFQLAGPEDGTLYGAVFRIFDQAQLVPVSLVTTLLPMLSANAVEPGRMAQLFNRGAERLVLVSFPAVALSVAAAEPLTVFLFGEDFRDAATALVPLMVAFALVSFVFLASHALIALGAQRRLLTSSVIGLVFNVAVNLVVIPEYGFAGAAWVAAGTQALVLAMVLWQLRAVGGPTLRLAGLSRAAAAAAGMALCVEAAERLGAPAPALAVLGTVVFVGLALAFNAARLSEFRFAQLPPASDRGT